MYRQTGLTAAQLQSLLQVGRSLVSEWRSDAVLQQVLRTARELTGARYAAIGVLDAAGGELEQFITSGVEADIRERIGDLPRGHGILGELIRDPRPLRLARISEHPRSYGFPAEHPPMETFLGVPVIIRGRVYGNLYLTEKDDGGEFDDRDERLTILLADWAAIAIDHARSHELEAKRTEELERALRGMRATVSLNRELTGETDLERVYELVTKRGRALVNARGCLLLLGGSGDPLRVAAAAGNASAEPRALADPARIRTALRGGDTALLGAETLAELGIEGRAGALAPLRIRGTALGALVAIDRIGADESFSADDLLALSTFAVSAATAIGATRQVEEDKRRLQIAASERERSRWAREIHDETLQELGALRVIQESALQVDDPETMRRALAHASEQAEHLIDGLQGLITELRPAALDQLGVEAAIEALVDRIGRRGGVEIEADIDLPAGNGGGAHRLASELEATIYRIVQEALTNVVKHAEAEHASVVVEARSDRVAITVSDDGRGLGEDSEGEEAPSLGFGLIGLRERAELLGGSLEVADGTGTGTRVTADLPLLERD